MGAFQRQIGDMVELTPEGEKEIHKYKNNYEIFKNGIDKRTGA